ncbi:hypothetical protein PHLCEN_2v4803 [Hermanssonia centrifuga]|uniref:Nuclear condensin complex subunit 3 C-terminal domain-containing protein n=1 Tax=Hermanssonia centrifuga TaxID=98765 RepID=A0A2R6PG96_9APHY|nr:hypothetical protein PHLCEN_2v4803 [Hermanssonia centrifuga]
MPARTVFSLDDLSTSVPKIFQQVQLTTANHQKNYIALYKLQTDAAKQRENVQNGRSVKLTGERAFEDVFISMLSRALPVKKGATVADRILKFVGGYTKLINEKAAEDRRKPGYDEDDDDTASRFVNRLLRFLFKGCTAKDKVIRFRVVQCIAEMVAHLGEIDEDGYTILRDSLLERVRDKEVPVRVQAVTALSKLCGSEDPSEQPNITDILLDTLHHDASADVRKAALVNLPPSPLTLAALLSRSRDVDPTIRKLVYSAVLEPNCVINKPSSEGQEQTVEGVGLTHPRVLSIAQRELIVRNGLGDREESVKAAAAKLMSTWVDVVRPAEVKPEEGQGVAEADLIAFLNLFDLVENSTAENALVSVFKTRVDLLDGLQFGDAFWNSVSPEKAFLARVFVDHCVSTKDDARLENALPVVTALAFKIQATYNELLEQVQAEEEEMLLRGAVEEEHEEERIEREFVIGEMLRMAVNLDYADEIGRRKMFQLVRDMISQDILPEGLVSRCLDVMRELSPSERDLIRVVVEVVHELRDPSDEDEPVRDTSGADDAETTIGETPMTARTVRVGPKPATEMSPEERARADAIDLRCLSLCIGMLERVNGTFEENSTLEGILGELIIPAVKRKELLLREKGLVSLGLCCLIARRMAQNSFQLFLSQLQSAPEVLKIRVLQIVFDIMMVHDGIFLGPGSTNGERIVEFLLHILDTDESEKVQALLCVGLSKLMLSGMVADERVLQSLVLIYISPETVNNQELRQCLSYFFPVYCYSSSTNQRRMQKIFIPLYDKLSEVYKEWDGDENMISPAQASLMFVDWTDPQKSAAVAAKVPGHVVDESIHVDLASNIIKALFNDELEKDDKKALCQLLGRLYLPDKVDDDKIRTLKFLMDNLSSRRPLRDSAAKNAFAKFETAISKKFDAQLADFNEEEYRQLEYLQELFEFVDDIIPNDAEEEEAPKRRGGKKRSVSVVSDMTSTTSAPSGDESTPPPRRKSNGKGKAKRRRLSQSDDESDEETPTERGGTPLSVAPTRVMPRRSAADKSRVAVTKTLAPPPSETEEEDEGGEDEEDEEDDEATPAPSKGRGQGDATKVREAAKSHTEIDDLSDGEIQHDSIMDSSEEEDADEVDDLLG